MLQYQDVALQQKSWFNGDADARLAVALDVAANQEEAKKRKPAGVTDGRT